MKDEKDIKFLHKIAGIIFLIILHFIFTSTSLAFDLDLSTILEETVKEKIPELIPQGTKKRERSSEEKQLSLIARDIIERGRIPDELREKYRYKQVYQKQGKGRVIAGNILELPPYSKARVRLKSYCMDSSLPAPASGEKMYLIPVTKLLIKDFIPIYEALMHYSALHPENYYQIQRIVWFMRHLSEERYIPSYSLVSEDVRLLESIYPGSSSIIENQKRKILLKRKISEIIDVLLDKTIPPEVKNVLRELSRLGYDINTPPGDLRTANNIVIETLRIINAMRPQGEMGDYSEYTLLPNDLAVKAEHGGGASGTTLVVANPTPEAKTLDFKQYVLQSDRDSQRLGLGGIESVEWREGRWEETDIARDGSCRCEDYKKFKKHGAWLPAPDDKGIFEVISIASTWRWPVKIDPTVRPICIIAWGMPQVCTWNTNAYIFSYNPDEVTISEWVDYLACLKCRYGPIGRLTIYAHGGILYSYAGGDIVGQWSQFKFDFFCVKSDCTLEPTNFALQEGYKGVLARMLLTSENLMLLDHNVRSTLARLKNEQILAKDAHILLFSCLIGQDEDYIQELANLTGAWVHANKESTGYPVPLMPPADWKLDILKGPQEQQIESSPPKVVKLEPQVLEGKIVRFEYEVEDDFGLYRIKLLRAKAEGGTCLPEDLGHYDAISCRIVPGKSRKGFLKDVVPDSGNWCYIFEVMDRSGKRSNLLLNIHVPSDSRSISAPLIDKSIPLGTLGRGNYFLRAFNIDDIATIKVNGQIIGSVSYYGDREFNITPYLRSGSNEIELTVENRGYGWTYGFELKKDGRVIWQDKEGEVGRFGARNNDQTVGTVYRCRISFVIQEVSVIPPAPAPIVQPSVDTSCYLDLIKWIFKENATRVEVEAGWNVKHDTWCGLLEDCRHTGIDFGAKGRASIEGIPVYSATDGKVVSVKHGLECQDKGCLSKVAIYNEIANVTFIYLHMKNIPPEVRVGSEIKAGQLIGEVGRRGPAFGPHLHFEIRPGRQELASDDVRKTLNPCDVVKNAREIFPSTQPPVPAPTPPSVTVTPPTSTVLTIKSLFPTAISTSSAPYDATLSLTGSGFSNVVEVIYRWSGAVSGESRWVRGDPRWNEKVRINSDTSMTLIPRVVESNPRWSGTLYWTVILRDNKGSTASASFTVTYRPYRP